jgi:hypothetical protein
MNEFFFLGFVRMKKITVAQKQLLRIDVISDSSVCVMKCCSKITVGSSYCSRANENSRPCRDPLEQKHLRTAFLEQI